MRTIDKIAAGRRLRALALDLGYSTTREFGEYLEAQRGTVDAWFNGRALVPARYLLRLQSDYGIPMEWVYSNDDRNIPYGRAIRLKARLAGEMVPSADEAEHPILAATPAKKAALRPRRTKKKEAT